MLLTSDGSDAPGGRDRGNPAWLPVVVDIHGIGVLQANEELDIVATAESTNQDADSVREMVFIGGASMRAVNAFASRCFAAVDGPSAGREATDAPSA